MISAPLSNRTYREHGFTVVELMIAVALVGVLASLAIPNYFRFAIRARQTEAKLALVGIYVAETSYAMESMSFTGCVEDIGYTPQSVARSNWPSLGVSSAYAMTTAATRGGYYAHGFSLNTVLTSNTCGPTGNLLCQCFNWHDGICNPCNVVGFDASLKVSGGAPPQTGDLTETTVSQWTFTAEAAGYVGRSGVLDKWTIDQNKNLFNIQIGM